MSDDRFWAKVDKAGPNGCWLWLGSIDNGRYGRVKRGPRNRLAHRWAYELLVGPIPDGLELDHLCRTLRCVNPSHLEPVLHQENVLRGTGPTATHAAKVSCVNGHEFTPANTMPRLQPYGAITRRCRTCYNAAERDRKHRRRAERAA